MRSNLKNSRVLVVDYDDANREGLRKLLEAERYRVSAGSNADQALDLFRSGPIDLVILDVNLGDDDGWQLHRRLVAEKPSLASIIITAEREQVDRATAATVDAWIEKPLDKRLLLDVLSEILAEHADLRESREFGLNRRCRYVPRDCRDAIRLLEERYFAGLELSEALAAALATCPPAQKRP